MNSYAPLDHPKVLSLEKAVEKRDEYRTQGKRLVLTNGCFDLLHPGHCYSLRKAKSLGAVLFVALNSDTSVRELKGVHRPILPERERAFSLACQEAVDGVLLFSGRRLTAEILALKPDIYCKSGDYTLDRLDPEERAALESLGVEIRFVPFLEGFSTTRLLEKIRADKEGI